MSWLVTHLWPWMLLAGVLGAVTTTVLMTTRVTVERWVEAAVETTAPEPATVPAAVTRPPAPAVEVSSPFPALPGAPDERPWEAEEPWSRPARLTDPSGRRQTGTDEWSEAASNWRTWAQEAAQAPVRGDEDLFAADREAERRGLEVGHFPAASDSRLADDDDPFPYARPVEASEFTPPVFPGLGGASGMPEERRTA